MTEKINEEIVLSGYLAEFRTALLEEVSAARRSAASSAISLLNGRRITQIGNAFQYIFEIENILNLPADTPADLRVPGKSPIEATIISIEGMAITLSVPVDIGSYIHSASLQSDLTMLLRKLIVRIEELGRLENAAGDRILGFKPINCAPETISISDSNANQMAAVSSAIGGDTTFIWGPPGTGKTHTIGEIGTQLFKRNRSLLLVSHTNTAVDQALLKIKDNIGDKAILAAGTIIRVGDPKDPRVAENPDLLLKTHVDRRSEELASRRDSLGTECKEAERQIKQLALEIDLCEWIAEAQSDIKNLSINLNELHTQYSKFSEISNGRTKLLEQKNMWEIAVREARYTVSNINRLLEVDNRIHDFSSKTDVLKNSLLSLTTDLARAEKVLQIALEIESDRISLSALPPLNLQNKQKLDSGNSFKQSQVALSAIQNEYQKAMLLQQETSSVGLMTRRWRALPSPEEQQIIVSGLQKRQLEAEKLLAAKKAAFEKDVVLLNEITELHKKLSPYENVPREKGQKTVVYQLQSQVGHVQKNISKNHSTLHDDEIIRTNLQGEIKRFNEKYTSEASEIIARHEVYQRLLNNSETLFASHQASCKQARIELNLKLQQRLLALRDFKLCDSFSENEEEMLACIESAYDKAVEMVHGLDLAGMRLQCENLNSRICSINSELLEIDEALKKVEELVIADAVIVATTLTRAYLRDSIQKRKFDTVIVDEASMAPIPALWVAASRAERAIVVVGDFKQLPPIVISSNVLAEKWLGKDIFEHAGLAQLNVCDPASFPPHFVALIEQRRMHPAISAIPNTFFYNNLLIDYPKQELDDSSIKGWYRHDWGHDSPVLLVDTGKADAWVTSVSSGMKASRLNFLSASICVDLAEQLLSDYRTKLAVGDDARIIIISPYRPHSRLIELLLTEQKLNEEVRAGTVHTFQGSEAGVVIFDMVNDDPHWKVGMFMPTLDEMTKRLLNVAVTRAKRRLIIVGDFTYIGDKAHKAFLGKELIPYLLQHYPKVDVLDVVPTGLAARSAKAQAAILGGFVEPDTDRIVVTQEYFFKLLQGDIQQSGNQGRIVIYSPFITQNRLGYLEPQIRTVVDRGVRIYVITKARQERQRSQQAEYSMLERTLVNWGVVVIHKKGMHEKLVFIGDSIVWSGSLNPLSFSNTQEIMERRDNKKVFDDYAKTLRLFELIGEFSEGTPRCPYCGEEVIASEGNKEPYYWRCINDNCYSRGVDQPRVDGAVVTCKNCGGKVEYGVWGQKPAWRCLENRHHYQYIAKSHLKLRKMREIIPSDELARLDNLFGIILTEIQGNLF